RSWGASLNRPQMQKSARHRRRRLSAGDGRAVGAATLDRPRRGQPRGTERVSPGLNRYLRGVAYARNQLHRISGSSLGPHEFLHEVSRLIRTVVPHTAPAWTTIDPGSLLPTRALESEKSPDLVRA